MNPKTACAAGLVAISLLSGADARAQSSDALIRKLVEKGILTTKEAEELRKEADADFTKAYQTKSGMADWVGALKFSGDVRFRYDNTYSDNSAFADRQRFRYRLRAGATLTLKDDFELGLRLISGPDGNPLTGNQTFEDNGSKKVIRIDQVYAKWSPLHRDGWLTTFTAGKMANPIILSDAIFDPDYTPEGFAQQIGYAFNKQHSAKLILGEFFLDEIDVSGHDPFLYAAQLRLDSSWTGHLQTSLGITGMLIDNAGSLVTTNVPDINNGNLRTAAGRLVSNFNPIAVDASATYLLDGFPGYKGAFPIKLVGEYLNNPAAGHDNETWSVGPTFGKAGKRGSWELSYRWRHQGGESWFEEFPDDDFGAFYQTGSPRGKAGFRPGPNTRGHVVRAAYCPFDSLTLSVTYFATDLIRSSPPGSESELGRVLVDALWKF